MVTAGSKPQSVVKSSIRRRKYPLISGPENMLCYIMDHGRSEYCSKQSSVSQNSGGLPWSYLEPVEPVWVGLIFTGDKVYLGGGCGGRTYLGRGVYPDGCVEQDVVTELFEEWCSVG